MAGSARSVLTDLIAERGFLVVDGATGTQLMAAGKSGATPAAVTRWGTTTRQRSVFATLATLPEVAAWKYGPYVWLLPAAETLRRRAYQYIQHKILKSLQIIKKLPVDPQIPHRPFAEGPTPRDLVQRW